MTKLSDLNIIAICGKAQSGKDTIAAYIAETYVDVYKEAFADPLKRGCSDIFGIPMEQFHEPDLKELKHPYWGVSPREIAQFVGTELFREKLGPLFPAAPGQNFWVSRLHGRLTSQLLGDNDGEYCSGDTIVIPDLRFPNEYKYLKEIAGAKIIFLSRPSNIQEVGIQGHASETSIHEISPAPDDYVIINNGTLEDLYAKVEHFIHAHEFKLTPVKFDLASF